MIKIINKKLSLVDPLIKSADSLIDLSADIDANYIGVFELSNGSKKIISFDKIDDIYRARLTITFEEIQNIRNAKFYVVMISGVLQEKTNIVYFKFDVELIKKDVRQSISTDVEALNIKYAKLENVINSLSKGHIIDQLNIKNKDYIKAGMIPVAIDDNGNCVMMYPFANHVVSVNGQKASNGVVELDASMIKYKLGKSLEQALNEHADALSKIADALKTISNNQKDIRKHLDELDIRLTQHLNDGII